MLTGIAHEFDILHRVGTAIRLNEATTKWAEWKEKIRKIKDKERLMDATNAANRFAEYWLAKCKVWDDLITYCLESSVVWWYDKWYSGLVMIFWAARQQLWSCEALSPRQCQTFHCPYVSCPSGNGSPMTCITCRQSKEGGSGKIYQTFQLS